MLQDFSARAVTDEAIEAGIAGLRGEITAAASSVSAVKIGGKRAYQLVREGQDVQLAERNVRIDRFGCWRFHAQILKQGTATSSTSTSRWTARRGTYIRALARDLGETLAVGGHLTALRRTRVGGFGLEHARTLEQLEEHPRLSYDLDAACLSAFAQRDIGAAEELRMPPMAGRSPLRVPRASTRRSIPTAG